LFYQEDVRRQKILTTSAGGAIFIACLGLFGLATFSAERRRKEIGIRKVLGASMGNITGLLTRDFLKLVVIAIVIASPPAWWVMQQWLADFAYRIDIQWWMFAAAGLAAVMIALLTVGFQSVRAAGANPVKSLRNE
jgi:putative ABC transport system permease protein